MKAIDRRLEVLEQATQPEGGGYILLIGDEDPGVEGIDISGPLPYGQSEGEEGREDEGD